MWITRYTILQTHAKISLHVTCVWSLSLVVRLLANNLLYYYYYYCSYYCLHQTTKVYFMWNSTTLTACLSVCSVASSVCLVAPCGVEHLDLVG